MKNRERVNFMLWLAAVSVKTFIGCLRNPLCKVSFNVLQKKMSTSVKGPLMTYKNLQSYGSY